MRVLVVGCGSIGTRRARIIKQLGHEVWLYDREHERALELSKELGVVASVRLDCAKAAVVLCTPPDERLATVHELLRGQAGDELRGLYVEKPLALDAAHARAMAHLAGVLPTTMGACNMRFDTRLGGIGPDGAWEALVLCMGQASRYWSANHRPLPMVLDSVHELDLAAWLLGPIVSIEGQSTLEWADVLTGHSAGYAHIHLDRKLDPPSRYLEVLGGSERRREELWPPDPHMYHREMEHFMACVERGVESCNPLEEAAEVTARALEVCG